MGSYFWVWDPQWTVTIHSIVIHNRGSLSQVPWRKDAEGQIGFLTEWGISYLGTVQGKLSHHLFVGLLLECHSYVPDPPESLRFRGDFTLARWRAPPAAEQHKYARWSHNKYLILFLLLWVTRTPHKELIFSPLSRPYCICRTLLNSWELSHL